MTPPLSLDILPNAQTEFTDLALWLSEQVSEDASRRFTIVFYQTLMRLCQEIAEQIVSGGRPAGLIDEVGSLSLSQPVRQHIFTTQKKRVRRSSSGTYRLYYTLLDVDKDGTVDTLRVLSVRHAASRPLWDV